MAVSSKKYIGWLVVPVAAIIAAAIFVQNHHATQFIASVEPVNNLTNAPNNAPFKNMLGVNAFEWNLLQNPHDPNDATKIYEPKMEALKTFSAMRHYFDWVRMEDKKGKYTFNPAHAGGWNFDVMYQRCKAENIEMLTDLKAVPDWLLQTYPPDQRDAEDVPMPYGADKKLPSSYVLQAKAGFQFAARYGSNQKVDPKLVTVDASARWNADPANEVKTGLNTVKYIECDNERDKWWKGDKAHQSPEEYAANLSAFYDGDKGRLGPGVGVKNADPDMKVVMGGLASADVHYAEKMIEWCKTHRGYRTDGSVNLCFDVINYHLYANDHKLNASNNATTGRAPELTEAGEVAHDFVALGNKYHLPVWVTEAGYDINQQSPQRAFKIGGKSEYITQADWILRTALLYERQGAKRLFFYELYDDNAKNPTQYASSGLVNDDLTRRPAADYILQARKLLGNYSYAKTISNDPIVDVYTDQQKQLYVLTVPDEKGRTASYSLSLPGVQKVIVHGLKAGAGEMSASVQTVTGAKLLVTVTETPVFVEILK